MLEESPFEKIMEEERRRQELFQNSINPPWKKALEDRMTEEDKLREQGALWASRLEAFDALGKSVAERIKMTDQAQANISTIFTAAQEVERRASEAFASLRDATERNELLADSVKDKMLAFSEKLRTQNELQLSLSPTMKNAAASFANLLEVGKSIADDAEKLYGKLSASGISFYGNLWEKDVSPAFASDAVGFMNDFIGEVEDDESEDALAVVRETVEYLKEHGKEFSLVSPKQAALIGIALCHLAYVFDYISKGLKAETLAPESGTIQIVWLYCTIVYTIFELKKKE